MAEYPTMPFHTDAYLADTMHLSNEEHGAYLRLLIIAWRSPDCCLPDDDKRLATMLGVTTKRWREKLRPIIEPFWRIENGTWTQKKQLEVRKKVEKNVQQKRNAYEQTERAKRLKNNDTGKSADLPGDPSTEEPTKTKTKESKGLGLERRSLRPGGTDPPFDQPDPKKFTMPSEWRMPGELQDELMAAFLSDLGEQAFWRQIGRFVEHHAEQGTVETAGGFAELLRGWLERANANREQEPAPAGPTTAETPAEPTANDIAPTMDLEEFRNRVFRLYDDSLAADGKRRMNTLEMGRFKMAADRLKIGQVQSIGLERGVNWTIADVHRLLGLSKREAA